MQPMFDAVLARNAGETEFHQAVYEVMSSLEPIAGRDDQYAQWSILKRICEPERQIIFRVPWIDLQDRALPTHRRVHRRPRR